MTVLFLINEGLLYPFNAQPIIMSKKVLHVPLARTGDNNNNNNKASFITMDLNKSPCYTVRCVFDLQ